MRNRTLIFLLLAAITPLSIMGQNFCSNGQPSNTKLVCQIPFATGVYSNQGSTSIDPAVQQTAAVFNTAIATAVSQLPLASSSSGVVEVYRAGVPQTYNSLGPILTDRASTVGRHALFLSFTASQFMFTAVDGIDLNKLPFAYKATSNNDPNTATFTQETLDVHFKIDQYVAIATFGVTNKLDVSMILPIERVSIGSAANNISEYFVNTANGTGSGPVSTTQPYAQGIASGIGDIVFAGKYLFWSGERSNLSFGLTERVPTGDDRNYLGSGAWGTNPYAVFSYVARVSPHVRLGYEWNSETELNPNLVHKGSNLALPGGLQYDAGADLAVATSGWAKHLTVAGDLMGDQYQNAPRLTQNTTSISYTDPTKQPPNQTVPLTGVIAVNSTYWINDISAGFKWNPYHKFIFTGNVLFQLNNVGMRARPTPLLGLSYEFGR